MTACLRRRERRGATSFPISRPELLVSPTPPESNAPPPRSPRRKPAVNLAAEAVKIVGGGVLGIAIALAILKYGLQVAWLNEPRPTPAVTAERKAPAEVSRESTAGKPPAQQSVSPVLRPRARQPLPSAEAQAAIRRDIDDIFAEQLRRELSAEAKQSLALQVAKLADEARDRPEERFVLLRKAAELAVEGGDLSRMAALVDEMAGEFTFDPLAAKAAFLRQFASRADEANEVESLVLAAKLAIDEARSADRYDIALPLAEATLAACRRPAGQKHLAYVQQGCEVLATTQQRWNDYQDAKAILAHAPGDPAANLTAGRWFCLEKGEWSRGLVHLAQGGAHPLADAARRDQAVAALSLDNAHQARETADRWYDVALADEGDRGFLARAHFWYTRAQSGLSGEAAAHVEARLDDILRYAAPGPAQR